MRLCYTYWVNEIQNISCGFGIPQLFFEAANKSIIAAKSQFKDICIYTNSFGADVLKNNVTASELCDIIEIDYSKYDFDCRYWNFPKLITYSMQEKPFIHIDFDVFLQSGFAKQLNKDSDIFTELIRDYDYVKNFDKFNGIKPDKLICSGLLGANNIEAFKENFEVALIECKPTKKKIVFEDLFGIEEYSFTQKVEQKKMKVQELDKTTFLHFQGKNKNLRYGKLIKDFKI